MGRPKITNRRNVRGVVLTLKLSPAERERLSRLVDARAAELHELTGQHIAVTASSYLRWLLDCDAETRGLTKPSRRRAD